MHPRTEELLQHLDFYRAELERAVESVPREMREQMPASNRWSVAEVLEHLNSIERRVIEILSGYLRAALSGGGIPAEKETSPVVPTIDLATLLDRSRRRIASQAALPSSGMNADEAWAALAATRSVLREEVIKGDGLALGEVIHPHPFLGPYNLHQWIAFVGAHEARHAAQIREIAEDLHPAAPGDE